MKQSLKILCWVDVVLGALAILGSLDATDSYAMFGGLLFLATGWLTLIYISTHPNKIASE